MFPLPSEVAGTGEHERQLGELTRLLASRPPVATYIPQTGLLMFNSFSSLGRGAHPRIIDFALASLRQDDLIERIAIEVLLREVPRQMRTEQSAGQKEGPHRVTGLHVDPF